MTVKRVRLFATVLFAVACVALSASTGSADHLTLMPEASAENITKQESASRNLDINLKFGLDGFRLGGRLFGDKGVAGLWLNGERRPGGFVLDGRLQNEAGRAFNFKVDAEAMDAATRAAMRWLLNF